LDISGFIDDAWVGRAIDIETAALAGQEDFPLLGGGAGKSLLLSGGLPEAQSVGCAGRQAVDDLVERILKVGLPSIWMKFPPGGGSAKGP
jgi:hypothetical protein